MRQGVLRCPGCDASLVLVSSEKERSVSHPGSGCRWFSENTLSQMIEQLTGGNQERVVEWIRRTLGEESSTNGSERTLRLVEEAVELAQACSVEREALHRLIDYVYERPAGTPEKEVAGVMVTLYGAASALGVDAQARFEEEMVRIWQPEVMDRVRRRQAEKREVTR